MLCGPHLESVAIRAERRREPGISRWTVEPLLVAGPLLLTALISALVVSSVVFTESEAPPWAILVAFGIVISIAILLVLDFHRLRKGLRGPGPRL